jgi:membrane fusion protein, multidrug efflux system
VVRGQELFHLDTKALEASFARAEAGVESSKSALDVAGAQYEKAVNGPILKEIRIAETTLKKAKTQEELAQSEWSRIKVLAEQNAVTESERDRIKNQWEISRQASEEAGERLDLIREGSRKEDIAAAKSTVDLRKAELEAAKAACLQAKVNLGYARVSSPFSGVIVRKWRDPGAIVSQGTPILTILNPASLHVSANIEEKYLNRIVVGDKVSIFIDAYKRSTVAGHVEKILRATNSRFSLIPAEGVSGTFIKVAQRVPLVIVFDSPPDLPLGPGLSVEVRIHSQSLSPLHIPATSHE